MSDSIQDLRALSVKVFDTIEEYLKDNESIDDHYGVYIDLGNSVEVIQETEARDRNNFYPLKQLIRIADEGGWEPDGDSIDDTASNYFFVR